MINTSNLIDSEAITAIIKEEVARIITSEVSKLLSNQNDLIKEIKQNAINNVVKQITYEIPELKKMVSKTSNNLLQSRINSNEVHNIIKSYLQEPVEAEVHELLVNKSINIENILKGEVVNAFANRLSAKFDNIDITETISNEISTRFEQYMSESNCINANADELELSVMDGVVVVENELVTSDAKVVNKLEVDNLLVVKNLQVTDGIDQSTDAWINLKQKLVKDVIEAFSNTAIDKVTKKVISDVVNTELDLNNATLSGKKLLTEDNLNDIEELKKLKVNGEAQFNDTFFVANKRVGINTQQPAMGLSVWDEDVNVLAGKLKNKTGFVGTANQQRLSLGVNRREDIQINEDGVVKVDKFQLGQNRVRFETDLPGYKGTKGDITYNTNISKENPVFAWVCLSGHNWLPIKAVI
jgi:hypothetical protein